MRKDDTKFIDPDDQNSGQSAAEALSDQDYESPLDVRPSNIASDHS